MTEYSAEFRVLDIDRVYDGTMNRTCFLTAKPPSFEEPVDKMHILGKGYDYGIRPKDKERTWFSSVFNLAWGRRDFHSGPIRDSNESRHLLLRLAYEKVMHSVTQGRYELSQRDRDFLEFSDQWKRSHPAS